MAYNQQNYGDAHNNEVRGAPYAAHRVCIVEQSV